MEDEPTPEVALLLKQKQEKKDLQAQIQSLKKTVTKGDKKKKKEVHDEITKLEEAMTLKHREEVKALKMSQIVVEADKDEKIDEVVEKMEEVDVSGSGSKLTKAQKRRQKKDQENRERDQRIAEQEVENEHGLRNTEMKQINEKLQKRGLMIFEIPPDGDCLYRAVDHGLSKLTITLGVNALRKRVSAYILTNPNDYVPFLSDPTTGDALTEEKFKEYCDKIANSKQWGGHVELDAMSQVVEKTLIVVQGEGPDSVIGEEFKHEGEIVLTYHRHMYRLGEHYNSVQPYVAEEAF